MMSYVIVFAVGLLVGVLLTFFFAKKWADKEVRKRCEIHSRFPKSWSSEDQEYYYKNAAEQMIRYVDERGLSFRGCWGMGSHGHMIPDEDWLTLFEFFRTIHSMGLGIKLYELRADGEDLEQDPKKAKYELWQMRHGLYPDIHAGFTF